MVLEKMFTYTMDDLMEQHYSVDATSDIAARYIEMFKSMPTIDYDKTWTKDKTAFSLPADTKVRSSET